MARIPIEILFGQVVRERRMKLNLSQEALGARAGLHRTYISDVERGARNLSLESIEKIAAGLQISIGNLFSTFTTEPEIEAILKNDLDSVKSEPAAVWLTVPANEILTRKFPPTG